MISSDAEGTTSTGGVLMISSTSTVTWDGNSTSTGVLRRSVINVYETDHIAMMQDDEEEFDETPGWNPPPIRIYKQQCPTSRYFRPSMRYHQRNVHKKITQIRRREAWIKCIKQRLSSSSPSYVHQ